VDIKANAAFFQHDPSQNCGPGFGILLEAPAGGSRDGLRNLRVL